MVFFGSSVSPVFSSEFVPAAAVGFLMMVFYVVAVQRRLVGTWRRTRCMKTRQLKPSWNALTATLIYRYVQAWCVHLSNAGLFL